VYILLRVAAIVSIAAAIAGFPSGSSAASMVIQVVVVVEPHCVVAGAAALRLRCNVTNEPDYRSEIRPDPSGELILRIDP
jgi:hypothetical protein